MVSTTKTVCVVGAGVSGLVSARELRREGHHVTVMEQSCDVGGQWLYDAAADDAGDPLGSAGAHSGVYASLRLNAPRDTMGFSDFPFFPRHGGGGDGGDARRYPGHGEFLTYIRDFCDAFRLMDAVRLNTRVVRVAVAPRGGGALRWTVRSCATAKEGEDSEATTETEEVFDAVVVASGQYSQPKLPAINGMEKWRRRQLHSHSYRVPDSFKDQVVVVVGCGESGKEIAVELRQVAMEVHVSVRSIDAVVPGMRKAVARHHNLHLRAQIEYLCEDGRVVFADGGSCVVADAVIYCTGYDLSFPFLDTAGMVTVDDNRVGPLYEHTFAPALAPSLSFVGVPSQVPAPLFYEVQARWVAQVLSGRRALPPPEEMMRSAEEYHRAREEIAGVPKRLSHAIFFDLDYCDEFGEKHCGFPRMEEWKKGVLRAAVARLRDDTESFRDDYHDSDLVLEGLRSEGWLNTEDNDDGQDGDGVPEPHPPRQNCT